MQEKKILKFQILVTTVGFLGLLFVPSIAWVFCHDAVGEDMSENRKLAEMPELTVEKIAAFPKDFESFWNDHLPFRKVVRSAWDNVNVRLLRDSTSEKVLIGKSDDGLEESWLFYTYDGDNNPVKDVQGILRFQNGYSEKAVDKIKKNTEEAKKRGVALYYLVAPSKEDIYVDYLPDNIKIYKDKSRTEILTEDLEKAGIKNYLFARDKILGAKSIGQLYYKDDTHWNELGAFVGFKGIMEMIEPEYGNFKYELVIKEDVKNTRDLVKMIGVTNFFEDDEPKVTYLKEMKYNSKVIKTASSKILETRNDAAIIQKSVMIVGDSYREGMQDYFAKVFRDFISVHRNDYKIELLDKYKPDILIFEFVERSSGAIASFSLQR